MQRTEQELAATRAAWEKAEAACAKFALNDNSAEAKAARRASRDARLAHCCPDAWWV